jgi:hypothetical protein
MIDENSHYSQQTKVCESNLFSLRKRAPIESLLTSTGIASSFSSQEPRRPRFSFFYLHNVKELTIPPSPASIVIGSARFQIPSENTASSPVARQSTASVRKHQNSGSIKLDVVQCAGLYSSQL